MTGTRRHPVTRRSAPQRPATMIEIAAAKPRAKPGDALAAKLVRLGIFRDEDLVLHLPLRYEDHTQLKPLAELRVGDTAQAEGVVVRSDIQYRPRRQLVCLIEDGASREGHAQLVLRLFSFYPSYQKTLARGNRVRVFGEVREGHYGLEIVHPQFKVVSDATPLADRLTPVYPTTAGLSQDTLRKIIARALIVDPGRTAEVIADEFMR